MVGDIDWDKTHPYKQVHQHAEDYVACFTELLRDLSAFDGQEEAGQRQQSYVAQHHAKTYECGTFTTLD